MKTRFLLLISVFAITGCAAISPYDGRNRHDPDKSTDQSPTDIPSERAFLIAQSEVRRREHWLEESWPKKSSVPYRLVHNVSYSGYRLNKGRWLVVTHRGFQTTNPHDTHDFLYDSIPAAIIIIDNRARVISYQHSSDWHLD